MRLLAIDTATEACSAALGDAHESIFRYREEPRGHARLILPMVDELLAEAGVSLNQLDAIVVGRGPGSFTGVRIGVSVAQGLAAGAGLGMIGVSDLAALAQAIIDEQLSRAVAVAFDARMDEVYWGCFRANDEGLAEDVGAERVLSPDRVDCPFPLDETVAAGRGWAVYRERLSVAFGGEPGRIEADRLPTAAAMLRLAAREQVMPPHSVMPVYLRDNVAWKKNA